MPPDYQVIYEPIEDGWVLASVPELPGAVTQAPTLAEAKVLIREAVALVLEAYREHDEREGQTGQHAADP